MARKFKIDTTITSAGIVNGEYDIANLSLVRVVVENANGSNEITFRAKIDGQSTFTTLKTSTGNVNETFSIQAYDKLQVEVTNFDATPSFKLIVSGFQGSSGASAVPSGEVAIGSGSGLTSDSDFNYDTGTDTLNVPNITLDGTDLGQTLYKPEAVITLTGTDITNKNVTLTEAPTTPAKTRVTVGGVEQTYGDDFTVSGTTLNWNGLGMDGLVETGDKLIITYN